MQFDKHIQGAAFSQTFQHLGAFKGMVSFHETIEHSLHHTTSLLTCKYILESIHPKELYRHLATACQNLAKAFKPVQDSLPIKLAFGLVG
jgi:hypothetical protein